MVLNAFHFIKNGVFITIPMYRVLRGEMKVPDFTRSIRAKKPCCADTSCTLKIYRQFKRLSTPEDIAQNVKWLEQTLTVGIMCATGKGGADSKIAETIFSICRMLGLRLRPL